MKLIIVALLSLLFTSDTFAQVQKYRTFSTIDLSETYEITKEVVGVEGEFVFHNPTLLDVNAIFVEFSVPVTILGMGSFTNYESQNKGGKDLVFTGGMIHPNEILTIRVTTLRKHVQVNKWWWMNNGKRVGITNSKLQSVALLNKLAMPNVANVRNNLFFSKTVRLNVGIAQPLRKHEFGWVSIKTSVDALKSLIYNGNVHFGQPRGFSRMGNGNLFHGQLKCLTPAMENNKLFAEVLALKFNILASEAGITPSGFGDLYYNEEWSPYIGRTIRQIAEHADSLITFWRGVMKVEYVYLDEIISQINSSYTGPMDTISYCSKMTLKGVESSVARLFSTTKPVIIPSPQPGTRTTLPLKSDLRQNYPNPFNSETEIQYSITIPSVVSLIVYNILGEKVTTLVNELLEQGTYHTSWNTSAIPSGVYIYKITAGSFTDEKRMLLLR